MSRSLPVLMSVLAAVILCACASQRPTPTVRESGDLRFKRGDYIGAAVEYQEIVARFPGDWEAQYRLGLCQMELGQLAEAERSLAIAHSRRRDHPGVTDALAEVLYRQGDEAQLFAFLRQQAESTQSVGAYLRLADYSMKMNDPDSATVAIETAIELDGAQSVEPYILAADVAELVGDTELAILRLRQALGMAPDDERIADRLRALGEVPGPTLVLPPGRDIYAP
ncbi:MAG: tetratricopeptide repeat protein [Planctomycetota bacterium]|nr:tetratricopeptide repeat protein [Planctomycetota bacterium]